MMKKFEQEFRKAHPETIGETDRAFDNSNYIDWLEEKLSSLQSKGKTDKSKLNDRDREMEGDLSVLIGSEIAIINKGTKQEIDWQMISEWLVKKIGTKPESKGKTKEEVTLSESERQLAIVAKEVNPKVENGKSDFYLAWRKCFEWMTEEYAQSHANQDGWVSCDERLPENMQTVLCCTHIGNVVTQSYGLHTEQDDAWFKERFAFWMPLPPKPQI